MLFVEFYPHILHVAELLEHISNDRNIMDEEFRLTVKLALPMMINPFLRS